MNATHSPKPIVISLLLLFLACAILWQTRAAAQSNEPATATAVMQAMIADQEPAHDLDALAVTPCVGGMAGIYPCQNVDLLAFMPLASIGGGNGNDIWGWTDPLDGKEYAIMGRTTGTAFVDISDPENPIYLGNLPTHTSSSLWRDIKVYNNHAFIVSEASGHGIQVFDLTLLRNVPAPPVTFSNTAHYSSFGSAHNIAINEDSGFAYGVGTSTCSGGLHMVNIQNPSSPTNAGCFSSDGYTHDTQCIIYNGPDTTHVGKEICFNHNEDTVTIVDVTNKNAPAQLSRTSYVGARYVHQGWVTDDHRYLLTDDELDEQNNGHNTRTYIWNISNLDAPQMIGNFTSSLAAIDHNQYVHEGYLYQANYRAGLQILDLSRVSQANLQRAAYFDIYPSSDSASFNGSWSVYPYFESGVVIVSGIEQGLFILQPNLPSDFAQNTTPTAQSMCVGETAVYETSLSYIKGDAEEVTLALDTLPAEISAATFLQLSGTPPFTSTLMVTSTTAVASTTLNLDIVGSSASAVHTNTVQLTLTAPPTATQLLHPAAAADIALTPTFTWTAVADATTYHLEVATDDAFTNLVIDETLSETSYSVPQDSPLATETQHYWRVTAVNICGSAPTPSQTFTTTNNAPPPQTDWFIFLPFLNR
jgi:choice-of-anchor B domain-containing protein